MIGDILQPTHLIFILVVALLVLGPKRLPEVGRSLGKGIRDFRGALSGLDDDRPVPEPREVAPVTPATTSLADESPLTVAEPGEPAHGFVPVQEATRVAPTPVAHAETVAVDREAIASSPVEEPTEVHAATAPERPAPAAGHKLAESQDSGDTAR